MHMKKNLLVIIIGIVIFSCSSSRQATNGTRYFDEKNNEIGKSKFNKIRSTNKLLDIQGDSINHEKLTLREKRGKNN